MTVRLRNGTTARVLKGTLGGRLLVRYHHPYEGMVSHWIGPSEYY